MAVTHVNRKGDTYYMLQGLTKSGKPRYYVSKKPAANTVAQIPDGYEFYENPVDGMVYVRKIRPTSILPAERENAIQWIRDLTERDVFFAECEGDSLVIYWPDRDPVAVSLVLSRMFGMPTESEPALPSTSRPQTDETVLMFLTTNPVLRFTLKNEAKRTFVAERVRRLVREPSWEKISKAAKLEDLIRMLAPHLGQDSLFDIL